MAITVDCSTPPVAVDDAKTVAEDSGATQIDVLANDTDVDGGSKTIASVTQPADGTVVITGGGSGLTYTPNPNYCNDGDPTDDFTYTLNGGDTATVAVTVSCVDDPPVAVNDTKTVVEEANATAIDVLANDTDVDGGSKTIASVTQPAHGTVVITGGGSGLSYTPDPNYCNDGDPTDDFTYTLNGGSTATVAVTVSCVDDPPAAVNDTATVTEDANATQLNVLQNDTDVDGGPKTVQSVTQPANGTVAITGGGSGLTYTPDPNYCNDGNPTDGFSYTLNGGDTATVAVTVSCVDDPPAAVNDTATVTEDAGATAIDVLANDTDIDGGPKQVASVTQPANGTVAITGGGSGLTYTPNPNYCNDGNPTDDFTYTLNGGSTATVAVSVSCVDDPPVAVNDSATVAEDANATQIDVLQNDTDVDGGPKQIASATQPTHGTVTVAADNLSLSYTPNPNYCNDGSPTDGFSYTLNGGSTTTVAVTVSCVDDAPLAVDDSSTVPGDSGPNPIDVLANDTDVDGGPKQITQVTQPANGTVTIAADNLSLTYQPDAGYCSPAGETDDFTYTLNGGSTATVAITVDCSTPPTAVDDTATVTEDAGATQIDVLGNDTDVDGGPMTIASVTQPANGTVAITGGGSGLTYTPAPNYCNDGDPTDDFTYTLNGGSTATVAVSVSCVDDPPVAVNDSATVAEDANATQIDVLAKTTLTSTAVRSRSPPRPSPPTAPSRSPPTTSRSPTPRTRTTATTATRPTASATR